MVDEKQISCSVSNAKGYSSWGRESHAWKHGPHIPANSAGNCYEQQEKEIERMATKARN